MLPPSGKLYGLKKWVEDNGDDELSGVGEGYVNQEASRSLIKAMEMNGRRSNSERKSTEACKSHREAERRRRQRINAHLTTLRSLLPNPVKSDKASLLAEVVQHVKRLRKQVDDVAHSEPGSVCSGSVPGVYDEVRVSYCDREPNRMKITMCCEDRPGLNRDLAQAIGSVQAKAVHAEMMTIGGRTKNVVGIQWEAKEEYEVGALDRALKAVIENRALMEPSMGQVGVGHKRVRDSYGWPEEVDYAFLVGTTRNRGNPTPIQSKDLFVSEEIAHQILKG